MESPFYINMGVAPVSGRNEVRPDTEAGLFRGFVFLCMYAHKGHTYTKTPPSAPFQSLTFFYAGTKVENQQIKCILLLSRFKNWNWSFNAV